MAADAVPRSCSDSDWERLLAVLEDETCMTPHALAHRIAPRPLNVDQRTRAAQAWAKRTVDLIETALELHEAGLIGTVLESDGVNPCEFGITEAGRCYLAEIRAL